jgi:DNA-binding NarL/FixJ family response regulator
VAEAVVWNATKGCPSELPGGRLAVPGVPVDVVLARFEAVLARGLTGALLEDERFRVVRRDIQDSELEGALVRWEPLLVIVSHTVKLELLEHLRAVRPATQILVFAHEPSLPLGLGLLAAGVSCLTWSVSEPDLLRLVHLAVGGRRFFVDGTGERIAHDAGREGELLTQREREVLGRIAKGALYSRIAQELGISVRTVHTHAAALLRKLGVANRRELEGIRLPRAWQSA